MIITIKKKRVANVVFFQTPNLRFLSYKKVNGPGKILSKTPK